MSKADEAFQVWYEGDPDAIYGFGVNELVKAGLRPPPPVRFPLSEGAEALQSLADGGVLGKVVLEP